jgi:23S rRNA pseudouridine1911/1915/1917 synthase
MNPRVLELSVPAPSAGERLDRFLASAQEDLSRSRLQALIREGRVRVNGEPARASLRLSDGDRIEVTLPEARPMTLEPEALPLEIVHEDESIFVVNKPAGVVVHPGAGVRTGTLVHALLHRDPGIAGVGGEGRPGIVHRLDRETSGLLVVARTPRAFRALIEQMRERSVARRYAALVWGDPRADEGLVENEIGRDPRQRKRMAVVSRGGKPARTHWRAAERFGLVTRLEVTLDTGRTHQIRVHMAHSGMPIVGDPTYGGRGRKQLSADPWQRSLAGALLRDLPRQALHALELTFPHPVHGNVLHLTAPLPDDFARALGRLRADRDHGRP